MSDVALASEIRRRIEVAGPMPVSQFISLCLAHPKHGYYVTRDPLGRGGDFVTAPEISQMFGELIGLWAASVWQMMGAPPHIRLVELGPGRGTLMRDAIRASQVVPEFIGALTVHLVEISPVLLRKQRETLAGIGVPISWHKSFEEVPDGPLIVIGNEFFDALAVRQAVKLDNGWHERVVEIGGGGNLAFGTALELMPHFEQSLPSRLRGAPSGAMFEWRPHQTAMDIGRCIVRERGAALIIDYGHTASGLGETLQAVGEHAYADPLAAPGLIDLTAHVDFEALADAAESVGARVHGPLTQGAFLRRLGIKTRAERLKAAASPEVAADIDAALTRLIGQGEEQMGELFKVMALSEPTLGPLSGFER